MKGKFFIKISFILIVFFINTIDCFAANVSTYFGYYCSTNSVFNTDFEEGTEGYNYTVSIDFYVPIQGGVPVNVNVNDVYLYASSQKLSSNTNSTTAQLFSTSTTFSASDAINKVFSNKTLIKSGATSVTDKNTNVSITESGTTNSFRKYTAKFSIKLKRSLIKDIGSFIAVFDPSVVSNRYVSNTHYGYEARVCCLSIKPMTWSVNEHPVSLNSWEPKWNGKFIYLGKTNNNEPVVGVIDAFRNSQPGNPGNFFNATFTSDKTVSVNYKFYCNGSISNGNFNKGASSNVNRTIINDNINSIFNTDLQIFNCFGRAKIVSVEAIGTNAFGGSCTVRAYLIPLSTSYSIGFSLTSPTNNTTFDSNSSLSLCYTSNRFNSLKLINLFKLEFENNYQPSGYLSYLGISTSNSTSSNLIDWKIPKMNNNGWYLNKDNNTGFSGEVNGHGTEDLNNCQYRCSYSYKIGNNTYTYQYVKKFNFSVFDAVSPGSISVNTIDAGGKFNVVSTVDGSGGGGVSSYKYYYNVSKESVNSSSSGWNLFTPSSSTFSNTVWLMRSAITGCETVYTTPIRGRVKLAASIDASATNVCYDSGTSITVNASGGTGDYKYEWFDGSYTTKPSSGSISSADTYSPTNLTSDKTYTCFISDNKDDGATTIYKSISISVYGQSLAGSLQTASINSGGNFTTSLINKTAASGGSSSSPSYTYYYNTSTSSVTASSSGWKEFMPSSSIFSNTVWLMRVASTGCETVYTTPVRGRVKLAATISASASNVCYGGSTTISVTTSGGTGSYNYEWYEGNLTSKPSSGCVSSANSYSPSNLTSSKTYTCFISDNKDDGAITIYKSISITVYGQSLAGSLQSASIDNGGKFTTSMIDNTAASGGSATTPTYTYKYNESLESVTASSSGWKEFTPSSSTFSKTVWLMRSASTGCEIVYTTPVRGRVKLAATINASATNVCYGGSTTITVIPSGGTESYNYEWYEGNLSSKPSSNLLGTGSSLQLQNLVSSGSYTCFISDKNDSGAAFIYKSQLITVYNQFNAGKIDNNTIIDANTDFIIGNNTLASGGNGGPYYQWYYGNDANSITTKIDDATSSSLTVNSGLTNTRYYKRVAYDGTCNTNGSASGSAASSGTSGNKYVVVTVKLSGSIANSTETEPICNGETTTLVANVSGGSGSYTYQWYRDEVNSSYILTNETNSSYTTSTLTANKTYYCVVTDNNNASNRIELLSTVRVYDAFVTGNVIDEALYNVDESFVVSSLTPASGGNGEIRYKWLWSKNSADGFKELYRGNLLRNTYDIELCMPKRIGYVYAGSAENAVQYSSERVDEWGAEDAVKICGISSANPSQGADIFYIGGQSDLLLSELVSIKALSGYKYVASAYVKNNSQSESLFFGCGSDGGDRIEIGPGDSKRVVIKFDGDGSRDLKLVFSTSDIFKPFDFTLWHPMIETNETGEVSEWSPCSDDNLFVDDNFISIKLSDKVSYSYNNRVYKITAANNVNVNDSPELRLIDATYIGVYDNVKGKKITVSAEKFVNSNTNSAPLVKLYGYKIDGSLIENAVLTVLDKNCSASTIEIPTSWNECSYLGVGFVMNDANNGIVGLGDELIVAGFSIVYGETKPILSNGPDLVIPNGIDNTLYFKRVAYDSKCNLDGVSSNVCSVKVNITADVNNPTENNPICNGTGQTEISVIAHGGCGQYFYQWSELLNNGQWHELSGQDKSNLILSGLTSNMTYKCVITDVVESDIQYTTPDIVVNVYDPLTIGVTNNTIYPIDYGSSVDIGGEVATGASGVYYYDWEISTNGQDFVPYLTNQGSQIHVSPLINTTYRRIDKDSLCGQLINVNIDVRVGLFPGTIIGDTTVCYNGTALVLGDSLPGGGSGKYEYHWQKLIPGSSSWENITESGVDAGYGWKYEGMGHIPGMYRDVKYRRMVVDQSNTALSAYSNEITVHVYDEFNVSFPEDEIICFGSSTSEKNVVATGGFGDYRYQWTSNYDPLFGQILSETSSLLDNNLNHSSDLQEGVTRYTIKVTDACGSTDGQGEGSIESSYKVTMLKPVKISPIAFDINGRNETSLYINDGESGTVRMFSNGALGGSSEYTYLWSYRDGHSNWKDFNNSNKTDHVISYSDFADTAYFRLSVTDSKCSESVVSDSLSFFIIPFNKPVLNGGQDICYSTVPSTIRLITRPGDGVYSYSWYKKGISDNEYVKMEGQVSDSLALANVSKNWLTENTYYKVRVSNGSREVDSEPILVTVLDQVDAGKIGIGVLGLEVDTVYADMMSPEIMNIMSAEGGHINPLNVSYQWYQKVGDKGAFTAIEGATGASYQPEEITKSVSYYRAVIDECKTVYSNTVTIIYSTKIPTNFVALSKPVLNNGYGQNICYNSVPSAFRMTTLAGDGEYSYSWYRKMESESSYQLIEGQVGDTLVLDDNSRNRLTESAYYKVRVSAGSRAVDSDPILVTVLDQVSGGKISVGFTGLDVDTVYAGMLPPILKNSISAEGGFINESNVSYQWYQKEDGQGNFTAIIGANNANYQLDSINKSVSYYREVIDVCGSAVSNTVTLVYSTKKPVNVITLQQPVINGGVGMNICYNSVPDAFRLTTKAGEGSYSYAWYSKKSSDKDYSLIEGYNSDTLVLSDISSNRLIESAYYKVRVSAGSRSVESDPILVTVLEPVNAGSIGIGNNSLNIDTVYYGQQPSLIKNVSLAEGGLISSNNSSYQWYEKNDGEYEFKLIEGAVSKDYQPGNLKKTTSYYRMVVDQCAEIASNTVKVVVKAAEVVVNPGGGGVVVNPGGEEEDPYEGMEEIYDDDDNVVMTRVKSSYCLGDKVELKLNSDVNGKFKWFDLDGYHIKDGRNFTISSLKNDSVLICKVYDNDGVVIAKQRIDVKVINVSVDFIASKTNLEAGESVHFVNSTSGYTSYEWNFGDGSDFSYDAEPWHYYHKIGTFDVTLTVETKEGCRSSYTKNDFVSVSSYSDIDDVETSSDFVVYPNPSDGVVNVVAVKPVTVDVFSSDNRVVARYLDSESHLVDLSSFAEGVYMFHIVGDGIDEIVRVVKY